MSSVMPDISKIFANYLRNSRQLSCPICQVDVKPPTLDGFKQHVQHGNSAEKHPTEEKAILDAFQRMKLTSSKPQPQPISTTEQDQNNRPKKISPLDQPNDQQNPEYTSSLNTKDGSDNKGRNKKICSPSSSPPPSTPNRRGRGRQQADNIKEFDRGTKGSSTRQLWSPSSSLPRSSQFKAQPPGNRSRLISRAKIAQHEMEEPDPEPGPEAEEDDSHTKDPSVSQLIRQPETRPISQEQLVAEVKAIYAGLPQVESKLIEVDNSQSANKTSSRQLQPNWVRNQEVPPTDSMDKQYYIAGSINGILVEALPNIGTDECFISSKLASHLGLRPLPGTQRNIPLANKEVIKSPGMIKVPWKFSKESEKYIINCSILPGAVGDLILGSKFLLSTDSMRKHVKFGVLGVSTQTSSDNSQQGVHWQGVKERLKQANDLKNIALLQVTKRLKPRIKEKESKQSGLLATTVKYIHNLTAPKEHKDAQEFSSREEEFDNTQHPKAKEKESKQSGLLATTVKYIHNLTAPKEHKDTQELSPEKKESDNTQHPKAKEKESKLSGLLSATVKYFNNFTASKEHKDAQEFSSGEEEFDNTQHPKAKEKESKLSRVLAAIVSWINSLITPTKSKCTKDFSSGEEEYFVAGSVNGTVVEALPDTGAEGCFISRDMASRFGFHPTPGQKKRITLANKKTIKSRGMVTVPWKFSEQQITHSINCWILPKCIRGLVLGYDFLKRTNCLGQVCSRSKAKILGESRRRLLSYLGNGNQRLQGELNGHSTAALPDTGSDAMFINGAYARRLGLDVDSDLKNQVQVRLADGSIIMTSGIVRDVEWRVGSTTVRCNFHVLEDLCVNVILSNSYLFGMKIYSEQEEHFFDINSESNSQDDHEDGYGDYILYFCGIGRIRKVHDNTILTPQGEKREAKLEELWRRDEARDKKAMLPKDQREAETKAEEARQQLWEAQKSEREAKWKAVYTVTGNVQHSVSRRNQWKERISISFLDELVERLTSTRSP